MAVLYLRVRVVPEDGPELSRAVGHSTRIVVVAEVLCSPVVVAALLVVFETALAAHQHSLNPCEEDWLEIMLACEVEEQERDLEGHVLGGARQGVEEFEQHRRWFGCCVGEHLVLRVVEDLLVVQRLRWEDDALVGTKLANVLVSFSLVLELLLFSGGIGSASGIDPALGDLVEQIVHVLLRLQVYEVWAIVFEKALDVLVADVLVEVAIDGGRLINLMLFQ